MKKSAILTALLYSAIYSAEPLIDANPMTITSSDSRIIREFDKLIYDRAHARPQNVQLAETVAYILKFKTYQIEYNHLKIEAAGDAGRRTARSTGEGAQAAAGDLFPSDFNYYDIGITVTMPLYDQKEARDIVKKKFDLKSKIIDDVKKFYDAKIAAAAIRARLELAELKQIRAKARTIEGIVNLDDRIKIIEDILDLREKLAAEEATEGAARLQLLAYVPDTAKNGLERLLDE